MLKPEIKVVVDVAKVLLALAILLGVCSKL